MVAVAMATDRNVYQIIDNYTFLGQQCSNVYFYQIGPGLVTGAADLLTLFTDQVLPAILEVQPAQIVHTAVTIQNLFNAVEYAEELMSTPGELVGAGENLPSFISGGYTLARQTPTTRSGKKRIAQAGEAYTTGGFWVGDGVVVGNTLADILENTLTSGAVQVLFPVIVGRILVEEGEYRLPETMAEAIVNGIVDCIFSTLVTTQNSRKVGVGE